MVNYGSEVQKEAIDFIDGLMDEFLEAMENDENYFIDGNVQDSLFESVTDRSYTLTDAAFVIENSNNPESDSGLWDGKDPAEALETQAAFTFSNDVSSDVEEIYEDVKTQYDEEYQRVYDLLEERHVGEKDSNPEDDDYDPTDDAREAAKRFAKEYFDDAYGEGSVVILKETGDKIRLLERYVRLGDGASMWSGYPCGSSYIDSRCGVGYGMPEIHDYVECDHEVARAIPEARGKNQHEIKKYLEELRKA
jgi:hypothetical protein